MKRNAILDIFTIANVRKVKMLTSYTANVARLTQEIADILLVGDSLGMVLYNMPSTHGVTLEMMINHTKAVSSVSGKAMIVSDMPFGTFEISKEQAFENASKLIIAGANAVKIEGGKEIAQTVIFLVERGIPVVGHVGLMPQKVNIIGGYKKIHSIDFVLDSFKAVYEAGAFAIVLENISTEITNKIADQFPQSLTIGIGAGTNCKGHVAVFEDLLNLSTENIPPFSRVVLDVKQNAQSLIEEYFNRI